jgi:hypothetical protein
MGQINSNQRKIILWLLVLACIIIIIVMAVIILGKKAGTNGNIATGNVNLNYTVAQNGSRVNSSVEVTKDKTVGNIVLQKSSIVYENGTSRLTSKVVNDSIDKDNLSFLVKFIANDGSIITEAVGFVGAIKANETKEIVSFITTDVSNAKDITYEILK